MVDEKREEMLIGQGVRVPLHEISWRYSTSGGPGGQHANTSNTRVEATFDISQSPSIPAFVKSRLIARFGSSHRVVVSDTRSQYQNKRLAAKRLEESLRDANSVAKKRRPTRPSKGATNRRLQQKSVRSEVKKLRRRPNID